MSSDNDQNQPNDPTESTESLGDKVGGTIDHALTGAEEAVSSVFDPLAKQVEEAAHGDEPVIQEPGDAAAEPPAPGLLPPDRPGASSTTGTGTSIAIGCVAVCAVILLITILILTIVS